MTAFDSIAAGLYDAIAFASGDVTRGRSHAVSALRPPTVSPRPATQLTPDAVTSDAVVKTLTPKKTTP